MADFNAVAGVLRRTISPDSTTIKNAEKELVEYAKRPGYASCLLSVIQNESVDAGLRLAAAIALKNFVRVNWNAENALAVAPLDENERRQLRDAILTAMFTLSDPYRRQLSVTICLIGQEDFPSRWPELITILAGQLSVNDFQRVDAALGTIEQLVHRHRSLNKSVELFAEIRVVLEAAAAPLTSLVARLMAYAIDPSKLASLSADEQSHLFEILLLATKCYNSLIWQDFPEYFEDHLKEWMEVFFVLIALNPLNYASAADHEPTPLDSIKRAICDIFCLFAQRYEEDFQPYILRAIENVWQLLTAIDQRTRYDALVNAALGFLSAVCAKERYLDVFRQEGVLQRVCTDVVIPNLTLRREDVEQFEDEPFDYLKRDVEGNDLETRRRGATEFVRALTKHFESDVFKILGECISSYMAEYAANMQMWMRKDVVYFLVSALASKSTTARQGATITSQLINVTDFYAQYVRADLFGVDFNVHPPILVADALNFVVLFRNHFKIEVLLEVFGGNDPVVLRVLQSRTPILHHYVGYAYDKLFTMQNQSTMLNAERIPVPAYLDGFCQALRAADAQKTHYLIKGILRSLGIMDARCAEQADKYVTVLVQLVEAVVRQSANVFFTHLVFECVCVVIKKAFPYIQATLNNQLVPIVEEIIDKNIVDFIPYALQLVAVLLYQVYEEQRLGRTVTGREKYESFLPHLLTGKLWQTHSNAPALMSILEAFVRSNPALIMQPANSGAVMGLYSTLIKQRAYEEQGFRLASVLMPHYNEDINVTARNVLMEMLTRLREASAGRMLRFRREFVMFLCRFAYSKGGMQLAEALNAIQAGLYSQVVDAFVVTELSTPIARNYDEKALIVLGLARLCADTVSQLGESFRKLVDAAIGVLEAKTVASDAAEETANDAEYTDPYCKLSNVRADEAIGAGISVKRYLATAVLSEAVAVEASCLSCLTEQHKQQLAHYASSL